MESLSRGVSRTLTFELIDAEGGVYEVQGELEYHATDPFAVVAVFHTGPRAVRWVFARDLLTEGIFAPAGEGDVEVWPCLDSHGRAVVIIELTSPYGQVLVQVGSAAVDDFLRHTFTLVPAGAEGGELDLDTTVQQLLAWRIPEAADPHTEAA